MTNVFVYPSDFCIKSLVNAGQFMQLLPCGCNYDIEDANDARYYYRIIKKKDGKVLFGHAPFGKDCFLANPVLMSDEAVPHKIFAARKSINRRFFKRQD